MFSNVSLIMRIVFLSKICEESVLLCPASCRALYRLGDAQLALYDNASEALLQSYKNNNRNRSELLNEAERSYRASLQFEGKSVNGTEHSMSIKDSVWFKMRRDTLSNSKHLKAQNATAATTSPSKPKQGTGKQGSQVSSSSGKGDNYFLWKLVLSDFSCYLFHLFSEIFSTF